MDCKQGSSRRLLRIGETDEGTPLWLDNLKLLQLEAHGYLLLDRTPAGALDHGDPYGLRYKVRIDSATRTDKVMRPYKPRDPERKVYNGVFPWSVIDHWKLMKKTHSRVFREQLEKLTGDQLTRYDPKLQDWEAVLRHPVVVETRSELDAMRRALCWLFNVPIPEKLKPIRWLPAKLPLLFGSGVTLRWLMLDMVVEPKFEGDQCVGFKALDPQKANDELERFANHTGNILEKYSSYMKSNGTAIET